MIYNLLVTPFHIAVEEKEVFTVSGFSMLFEKAMEERKSALPSEGSAPTLPSHFIRDENSDLPYPDALMESSWFLGEQEL